jgi:hypothetical protein
LASKKRRRVAGSLIDVSPERILRVVSGTTAAVVALLTISVIAQALSSHPDFPGGEFMQVAVYSLANPVIAAFGFVAVATTAGRAGGAVWVASLCAAMIAFAAVAESLLAAGVEVFGNGHSPYVTDFHNAGARIGGASVACAAGVVAVATLVIAERSMRGVGGADEGGDV